ncbi:class I SAM-dependent methyltransferase, partial [Kaarinaea lacus]
MSDKQQQWNQRYLDNKPADSAIPALVLTENAHLLPDHGNALDLACGTGGNALFMAKRGLHVFAWDYSDVAIEQLKEFAGNEAVRLEAEVRDV